MNATLSQYIHRQSRVVDYARIAAGTLWAYDYILTVHLEVKLIWWSPWTYTKALFFLTRYLPLVYAVVVVHYETTSDIPLDVCVGAISLSTWLVIIEYHVAEIIFGIRTWALWHTDRRVGIGLGLLIGASMVVGSVLMTRYNDSLIILLAPFPGFRGCFLADADGTTMAWSYGKLLFVQSTFLALILLSAFRSYRLGDPSSLANIVYRDGILFYLCLICLSIGNIIFIISSPGPEHLMRFLSSLESGGYSIFTSRIILNIREAARKNPKIAGFELHSQYVQPLDCIPLETAADPEFSNSHDDEGVSQMSDSRQA